jgi:hypothetical protein
METRKSRGKKYSCLYDLKERCEARKFVEQASRLKLPNETMNAVEKALRNQKGLQFDDKQTAKDIGRAFGEGVTLSISSLAQQTDVQSMSVFCSMCPERILKTQNHESERR